MVHQLVDTAAVLKRLNTVNGIHLIKQLDCDLIEITEEIIQNWTDDYYNDEGDFGSSDFTYLLKDIIDTCIGNTGANLRTVFSPYLSVISKEV